MFIDFFFELKQARLPVTLREYLTLIEGLEKGVASYSVDDFYYLARTTLVKDETNLDKFDRVFGKCFKGLDYVAADDVVEIPAEWLRAMAEKYLTPEEMAKLEALDWDELMATLKKRLEEQEGRHEGGSKWIGTGGTSPFGAHGSNPAGIRIGQDKGRHGRAVKVWDKREYKNLVDGLKVKVRDNDLVVLWSAPASDVWETIEVLAKKMAKHGKHRHHSHHKHGSHGKHKAEKSPADEDF